MVILIFFVTNVTFSQDNVYAVQQIADSLKQNADAIVRYELMEVAIKSQREMEIREHRVVTVLNSKGLDAMNAYAHYDKTTRINAITATIYNDVGMEIKRIKRKDFKDVTVVDGGTIFSDNRVLFLEYTPTVYPFTMVYECETTTSNTAFIPTWHPIKEDGVSIEKSICKIQYPEALGFKYKSFNLADYKVTTREMEGQREFELPVTLASRYEDLSPVARIYPKVMFGLTQFHLEGVDGKATNWTEFGKWYQDEILTGTLALPEATVLKAKSLVGSETRPMAKAKILYEYLQSKVRYVSIQIGIGGWKPMYATDVDRLGYGDCKALSNYMKALLQAVDVPSYHTILYGNRTQKDIDPDFVSMQGNHMILCVPDGANPIWLECTSQDSPFGYQANFTDDRMVLVIKPEGGEIVKTKTYLPQENLLQTTGQYTLEDTGVINGNVTLHSKGTQYGYHYRLATEQALEVEKHYKHYWQNIENLKIVSYHFVDDKNQVDFEEQVQISAENYGKINQQNMIFAINGFNQSNAELKRIRNRKTPFEIQRGFTDQDDIEVTIPKGYVVEFLPSTMQIENKYGVYQATFVKKDAEHIRYSRKLMIKSGTYPKAEYDAYRLFREQVAKNDNAKVILKKI